VVVGENCQKSWKAPDNVWEPTTKNHLAALQIPTPFVLNSSTICFSWEKIISFDFFSERKAYFFAIISPRIRSMTMHVLLLWTKAQYMVNTDITVFLRTNWIACAFIIMVNMLILMQNFGVKRTPPRMLEHMLRTSGDHNLDRDTRQKASSKVLLTKLNFGCDSRADNGCLNVSQSRYWS